MFDLTNKVALITGGSGVLGRAMAKGLIDSGAQVAILGRNRKKLDDARSKITGKAASVISLEADVLNRKSLEMAKDHLIASWGRLDILINCAGGNLPGATVQPNEEFFDLSIDDFDGVTDLNLKGTLLPTIVFGKLIAKQKSGSIINISSMAADRPLTRVVGYSAAKAAINNLTQWLAIEMIRKYGPGIRVNAIAPGFFIADQNRRLLTNEDGSYTARGNTIIEQTPMRRFGQPEELMSTVVWLCSNSSSFITGTIIPVDGGFSAFSGV